MDERRFWEIVESARRDFGRRMKDRCDALEGMVSALPMEDALEFARLFGAAMERAHRPDLLWAAELILGERAREEDFRAFKAGLISRGRKAFEAALANPEALADDRFEEDAWRCLDYEWAVSDGIARASGGAVPEGLLGSRGVPRAEGWEESQAASRFPRLFGKFGFA